MTDSAPAQAASPPAPPTLSAATPPPVSAVPIPSAAAATTSAAAAVTATIPTASIPAPSMAAAADGIPPVAPTCTALTKVAPPPLPLPVIVAAAPVVVPPPRSWADHPYIPYVAGAIGVAGLAAAIWWYLRRPEPVAPPPARRRRRRSIPPPEPLSDIALAVGLVPDSRAAPAATADLTAAYQRQWSVHPPADATALTHIVTQSYERMKAANASLRRRRNGGAGAAAAAATGGGSSYPVVGRDEQLARWLDDEKSYPLAAFTNRQRLAVAKWLDAYAAALATKARKAAGSALPPSAAAAAAAATAAGRAEVGIAEAAWRWVDSIGTVPRAAAAAGEEKNAPAAAAAAEPEVEVAIDPREVDTVKADIALRLCDKFKLAPIFARCLNRSERTEADIELLFRLAPYLGKWNVARNIGDLLIQRFGSLDRYHESALDDPAESIDYSMVYRQAETEIKLAAIARAAAGGGGGGVSNSVLADVNSPHAWGTASATLSALKQRSAIAAGGDVKQSAAAPAPFGAGDAPFDEVVWRTYKVIHLRAVPVASSVASTHIMGAIDTRPVDCYLTRRGAFGSMPSLRAMPIPMVGPITHTSIRVAGFVDMLRPESPTALDAGAARSKPSAFGAIIRETEEYVLSLVSDDDVPESLPATVTATAASSVAVSRTSTPPPPLSAAGAGADISLSVNSLLPVAGSTTPPPAGAASASVVVAASNGRSLWKGNYLLTQESRPDKQILSQYKFEVDMILQDITAVDLSQSEY